jgi:hypothetical protein
MQERGRGYSDHTIQPSSFILPISAAVLLVLLDLPVSRFGHLPDTAFLLFCRLLHPPRGLLTPSYMPIVVKPSLDHVQQLNSAYHVRQPSFPRSFLPCPLLLRLVSPSLSFFLCFLSLSRNGIACLLLYPRHLVTSCWGKSQAYACNTFWDDMFTCCCWGNEGVLGYRVSCYEHAHQSLQPVSKHRCLDNYSLFLRF